MSDERKLLSRRSFALLSVLSGGLLLAPRPAQGAEADQVVAQVPGADDPYASGVIETFSVGGKTVTNSYSYEDGCRNVYMEWDDGETKSISFDTKTGILYVDGDAVSSFESMGSSDDISPLADEWKEIDRGQQSVSWVVGSTAFYISSLISPFLGLVASTVYSICGKFLEDILQTTSYKSLTAYAVWESYFTIFFQQTRVRFYLQLPNGRRSNEYTWHFSNV